MGRVIMLPSYFSKLAVYSLVLVSALTGCSSGASDSGSSKGDEPWLSEPAEKVKASGTFLLSMDGSPVEGAVRDAQYSAAWRNFQIGLFGGGVMTITLDVAIAGVGSFQCGTEGVQLDGNINNEGASKSSDCAIEITEFGNVGEPVVGSFTGTLGGHTLEGSFDIIRGSAIHLDS